MYAYSNRRSNRGGIKYPPDTPRTVRLGQLDELRITIVNKSCCDHHQKQQQPQQPHHRSPFLLDDKTVKRGRRGGDQSIGPAQQFRIQPRARGGGVACQCTASGRGRDSTRYAPAPSYQEYDNRTGGHYNRGGQHGRTWTAKQTVNAGARTHRLDGSYLDHETGRLRGNRLFFQQTQCLRTGSNNRRAQQPVQFKVTNDYAHHTTPPHPLPPPDGQLLCNSPAIPLVSLQSTIEAKSTPSGPKPTTARRQRKKSSPEQDLLSFFTGPPPSVTAKTAEKSAQPKTNRLIKNHPRRANYAEKDDYDRNKSVAAATANPRFHHRHTDHRIVANSDYLDVLTTDEYIDDFTPDDLAKYKLAITDDEDYLQPAYQVWQDSGLGSLPQMFCVSQNRLNAKPTRDGPSTIATITRSSTWPKLGGYCHGNERTSSFDSMANVETDAALNDDQSGEKSSPHSYASLPLAAMWLTRASALRRVHSAIELPRHRLAVPRNAPPLDNLIAKEQSSREAPGLA